TCKQSFISVLSPKPIPRIAGADIGTGTGTLGAGADIGTGTKNLIGADTGTRHRHLWVGAGNRHLCRLYSPTGTGTGTGTKGADTGTGTGTDTSKSNRHRHRHRHLFGCR
ncbi:MAG: hypothetical protein AAFQ31_14700, partial [Planctomycetota bacterium]